MVRVNIAFARTFLKEYSTSFVMVCRLIDFPLVVLKLLMFEVCVIIGISNIGFFSFSGTERVKSHKKYLIKYYIKQTFLFRSPFVCF